MEKKEMSEGYERMGKKGESDGSDSRMGRVGKRLKAREEEKWCDK